MKLSCGETYEEELLRIKEWHRFCPLWPRRVGPRDCRVFEVIERRYITYDYPIITLMGGNLGYWEYRSIPVPNKIIIT